MATVTPSARNKPAAAPRARRAGNAPAKKAAKKVASPVRQKTGATAKTDKAAAPKIKNKLVRDSFTIPKTEYAVLTALKDRALSLTRGVKKSELLRAGISALNTMHDKAFLEALDAVPSLKTGRPKHA
jgi:hypothetical protein